MEEEPVTQTTPLQDNPPHPSDHEDTVAASQINGATPLHTAPTDSGQNAPTLSHRSKVLRMVLLYAGFILLGMMMSVLGPTLLDLQYISESTTEQMAFVITARSIGTLVGCLLSSVLMRYLDPWLTLGMCNIVIGVSTIVVPFCSNVYVLIGVSALQGMGGGQFDAGGNICLLSIWLSENGSWMQALHLFYGVGTIIGPLLVEPFLVENPDLGTLNSTMDSSNHTLNVLNSSALENSSVGQFTAMMKEESRIMIPYGIIGSAEVLIGLVFFVVFVRDGLHVRARKYRPQEGTHAKEKVSKLNKMRIVIIVVIFFFYSVYCTVESEMGSFLLLFCVKFLGWTKSNGAWLTAAFWTTFTVSRAVGILLVRHLKPQTIIFADIAVALCGVIALVFFLDYHPWVMWVGSLVIGAGIATIYATGISWTEQYITVTEAVGSVFGMGSALTDMYGPILIVYLMEYVNYMSFIYIIMFMICAMLVIMIVLQLLANQYTKWKKELEESVENKEEAEPMHDIITEVNT